jgi:hypothetical protein
MDLNPNWVTAGIAVLGFLANGLWLIINLRIENKIMKKIDELKLWADERFVQIAPEHQRRRAHPAI